LVAYGVGALGAVADLDVDEPEVSDEPDGLSDAGAAGFDAAGSGDDPLSPVDVSVGAVSFGLEVELAAGRLSVL